MVDVIARTADSVLGFGRALLWTANAPANGPPGILVALLVLGAASLVRASRQTGPVGRRPAADGRMLVVAARCA